MVASATAATDAADEAGGEAVFASDGLPPLATPLPPPPLPPLSVVGGGEGGNDGAAGGDDGDAAVVESLPSDPRAAFDAFACSEAGGFSFSGGSAAPPSWEDPRRRLLRLKSELDSVEAQLASEQHAAGSVEDDENLRATTAELRSRLAALGMGGDAPSLATMLRGRQEDLTGVIARDLKQFGEVGLAQELGNLSLEGKKEQSQKSEDGKIVYELYRSAEGSLAGPSAGKTPREALLEERLRRLELFLGSSATSSSGDLGGSSGKKSLVERLEDAERLASESDPKTVEKLAAKAKVVRADLEAAARARSKLASKSSGAGGPGAKEDAAKIAALHAQLLELEGVSSHLPALTVRLLELSGLHSNAADFASRLDAAEESVSRSEGALAGVEDALKRMEDGWKANAEGVEESARRLDELLAKAGSS
ncbi:hypothetical protein ACHAWF_011823 [Thalassiosira exigua]